MEDERKKLFDEVWEAPISTVAKKYGLSDNGLRKRCINLEIPLPPMGHWAKVQAGKEVNKKPELPPIKGIKEEGIKQNDKNKEHTVLNIEDEEFEKWCNKIYVCKKVSSYNKLINDYHNEIEYRKKRDEEHRFHDVFMYSFSLDIQQSRSKVPYRNNKAVLAIDVSDKQINRASKIMDTFITCVKELKGRVSVDCCEEDNTKVNVFDTNFAIKLAEVRTRRSSITEKNETKNSLRPMYEKVPIGIFEIEICELRKQGNLNEPCNAWKIVETVDNPVEGQIGRIFIAMRAMAEQANQKKRIAEQEYQLKLNEERQIRELQEENKRRQKAIEERKKRRQALSENIDDQMEQWNKAKELMKYVKDLEEYATSMEEYDKELLYAYIELVKARTEQENPITRIINEVKYIGKENLIENNDLSIK